MMLDPVQYIFLGVIVMAGLVWALSSMGVIRARDDELLVSKRRHIEQATKNIELTYDYLDSLPLHSRVQIMQHLDDGRINHALETSRGHHDVFHFFKNH